MSTETVSFNPDTPVLRIDEGGTAQILTGLACSAIVLLLAYGPLVVALVWPSLFADTGDKDAGIGLLIWWAICMSFPVWVASQMTIRNIVEVDARERVVRITDTTTFFISRTNIIKAADIKDVRLAMSPPDSEADCEPLPLPVIETHSGQVFSLAAQAYTSPVASWNDARVAASAKLVATVRAIVGPKNPEDVG